MTDNDNDERQEGERARAITTRGIKPSYPRAHSLSLAFPPKNFFHLLSRRPRYGPLRLGFVSLLQRALATQNQAEVAAAAKEAPKRRPGRPRKHPRAEEPASPATHEWLRKCLLTSAILILYLCFIAPAGRSGNNRAEGQSKAWTYPCSVDGPSVKRACTPAICAKNVRQ